MASKTIMVIAVMGSILLASCFENTTSKATFSDGLRKHLENAHFCIIPWPSDQSERATILGNQAIVPQSILDDLNRYGIIKLGMRTEPNFFRKLQNTDLTNEGQKVYHSSGYNVVVDKVMTEGCLAFGVVQFKEVTNFTEPADLLGFKVSHVDWNFRVTNVPQWLATAKGTSELASKYGDWFTTALSHGIISTKSTFVLTNNGWIHERFTRL